MAGRVKKTAMDEEAAEEGPARDERGLTDYDRWRGRQVLCHVCHGRPCALCCPEQWMPDRPEWKAARAGRLPVAEHSAQAPDERRIPVEAAMAQAMAVVAGEVRADELAPPGGAAVVAQAGTPT